MSLSHSKMIPRPDSQTDTNELFVSPLGDSSFPASAPLWRAGEVLPQPLQMGFARSSILHPGDGSTWELFCSKQLVPDWLPKSPRSWGQSFGPHDPSLEADRHPQATGTPGKGRAGAAGAPFPSRVGAIEKPCFLTPTPNNPAEPSLAPRATHPECLATFLPEETMYPWLPSLSFPPVKCKGKGREEK